MIAREREKKFFFVSFFFYFFVLFTFLIRLLSFPLNIVKYFFLIKFFFRHKKLFRCLHLNLNGIFFPASEIWDFYPKARFLFIVISSNFFGYWRLFWNVLSYCRMVHRDDKRFLFFNYEIDFTVETVKKSVI